MDQQYLELIQMTLWFMAFNTLSVSLLAYCTYKTEDGLKICEEDCLWIISAIVVPVVNMIVGVFLAIAVVGAITHIVIIVFYEIFGNSIDKIKKRLEKKKAVINLRKRKPQVEEVTEYWDLDESEAAEAAEVEKVEAILDIISVGFKK
jgi:hypothetical protein